jgi:hypothetical protein
MTKHLLSLAAAAALLVFAGPASACDMHKSHAALTTAQAAPAPEVEVMPVTVIRTQIEEPAEAATISKPYASESGFMGCERRAKEQTVYLTQ